LKCQFLFKNTLLDFVSEERAKKTTKAQDEVEDEEESALGAAS
jgi:hypothetical protein